VKWVQDFRASDWRRKGGLMGRHSDPSEPPSRLAVR
jgi:hypothetical protein